MSARPQTPETRPETARRVAAHWRWHATRSTPVADLRRLGLTARQWTLLALLADGHSDAQIAAATGRATRTIANQLAALYAALDLRREATNQRVAATRWYLQHREEGELR